MKINYRKVFGFTLLELMISLAIIGVILTLGVPNLLDTIVNSRVNGAILTLNKDIVSARSYAINYETNITICHLNSSNQCDNNWAKGYTVFIDANANNTFNAIDDEKLLSRNEISEGDKLVFTNGTSLQYQFDGTILTALDDEEQAIFKYCPSVDNAETFSRAIILSPSGRPRSSADIDNDNKDEINGNNDHINCD